MDKLINERGLRHLAEILDDKYLSLDNTNNFLTKTAQTLTSDEKTQVRTNIGAGTSNLTIGTTAGTAAAGNHTHDEYLEEEDLFEEYEEYNNNGHEYVDLGLPSGTLWATENVKTPNGVEHFAWGDPQEKNTFNWSTYPDNPSGDGETFTKYKADGKIELDLEDDPANVYFGGDWRSPSLEQLEELKNSCTWTWKDNGYEVVGPNGNKIFLPAAGDYVYSSLSLVGSYGYYQSRSLFTSLSKCAYYMQFGSKSVSSIFLDRYYGLSIRPVLEKSTTLKKIKPELLKDCATKDIINIPVSQTFLSDTKLYTTKDKELALYSDPNLCDTFTFFHNSKEYYAIITIGHFPVVNMYDEEGPSFVTTNITRVVHIYDVIDTPDPTIHYICSYFLDSSDFGKSSPLCRLESNNDNYLWIDRDDEWKTIIGDFDTDYTIDTTITGIQVKDIIVAAENYRKMINDVVEGNSSISSTKINTLTF